VKTKKNNNVTILSILFGASHTMSTRQLTKILKNCYKVCSLQLHAAIIKLTQRVLFFLWYSTGESIALIECCHRVKEGTK